VGSWRLRRRSAGSIGDGADLFELVDQILEMIDDVRVVEVRLVARERDDLSVAFGCLVVVAFSLAALCGRLQKWQVQFALPERVL
jgi:hypothetical protein